MFYEAIKYARTERKLPLLKRQIESYVMHVVKAVR